MIEAIYAAKTPVAVLNEFGCLVWNWRTQRRINAELCYATMLEF